MLKILYLEDSKKDIEIIRELLKDSGLDFTMDCTKEETEFESMLRTRNYNIILADFKLPGFDGFQAFQKVMEISPDVPFICVSGAIGEETAVELLKRGAVDYVLKDRLKRLPSAIKRALDEAKEQGTLRHAYEETRVALAKYKALFDCFPLGINVTDNAGNILETNLTAENLLGVPRDTQSQREIDSSEWSIIRLDGTPKPPDEYASVRALKQKCKVENVEMGIVKSDDKITWINVSATPIPLEGYGVVITFNDITERINSEKQIISAKEKAEEMNRLKSSFLANMSHELRTPLMYINGFSDILQQDIGNPEFKEMARDIFKSGVRLSETLNLILDLSKLESEKMDFVYKKVDLVKETEDILKLFTEEARKKGLFLKSLFSHPSLFLNTDGRAIRSILNNLINNAVKYTIRGGITVGVSLIDDFVEIKVIDTGIGISKDNFRIIFDEFRQVSEGISRNFEGTGLGLNITKKLVEKFGGVISLESEIGKGTSFTVKLPVTNKEEIMDAKTTFEEAQLRGATGQISIKPVALLVDDDPYAYPILKKCSEELIDLESSLDSESAFNLCNQKQYSLIFMDINLRRGIDGIQLTQKIRKISGYENIPIIAFTAFAMVGDREEFLAAGCSHYLSKPFTLENVRNLLEEIFRGR